VEAIQGHKEIKQAMQVKVSRERIGIEVRKMFSGKNPTRALRLLIDLDLMDIVFDHEKKNEDIVKGVGERRSSIRGYV
jgi:tRNA nucleotidyltransferase (CCA-adding enzyme)